MKKIVFGEQKISIEDIELIAKKECEIDLNRTPEFIAKINAGADFLDNMIAEHGAVYGVTTGYGDSCTKTVPANRYYVLPVNLSRFHGCGLGEYFDAETTRAIIAVRLVSLVQACSGVSFNLVEALFNLLQHDILPRIPQEGSVGASGDLTPLSYIVAALIGERDVVLNGAVMPATEALQRCGLKAITLRPKEALAIMNGTAAMTGVACLAFCRAKYLADLSCRLTAMVSIAMKGNEYHFDPRLFAMKPHPGQSHAADLVRKNFSSKLQDSVIPEKIQDNYSVRCAPHIIGVFYDFEPTLRSFIETELNSANDNPLVSPEYHSVFHGGHFYGGHIAFAMDSLKNIVANFADLADRQLALLVDEKMNKGLPPNLSGSDSAYSYNHGLKAVQIGASAWTAEALKNTMPASVFSRSTECHNQDKVSMGTIAARDCTRVIVLTAQVLSALMIACYQAIQIRKKNGLSASKTENIEDILAQIAEKFDFLVDDRPLEKDLRTIIAAIDAKYWKV